MEPVKACCGCHGGRVPSDDPSTLSWRVCAPGCADSENCSRGVVVPDVLGARKARHSTRSYLQQQQKILRMRFLNSPHAILFFALMVLGCCRNCPAVVLGDPDVPPRYQYPRGGPPEGGEVAKWWALWALLRPAESARRRGAQVREVGPTTQSSSSREPIDTCPARADCPSWTALPCTPAPERRGGNSSGAPTAPLRALAPAQCSSRSCPVCWPRNWGPGGRGGEEGRREVRLPALAGA